MTKDEALIILKDCALIDFNEFNGWVLLDGEFTTQEVEAILTVMRDGEDERKNLSDWCADCGAEIPPGDFHACQGRPGESE